MSRNQTAIVALIVALFLACNLATCCIALIAGTTLGTMRARCARRWAPPRGHLERDFERPMPLPRQPREPGEPGEPVRVGVLVLEVAEDGPADAAGIETGDLILAVDGEPIQRDSDLREWLSRFEPGDRISLTVRRGERRADVQVRLGRRQADDSGAPYLGITYRLVPLSHDVD